MSCVSGAAPARQAVCPSPQAARLHFPWSWGQLLPWEQKGSLVLLLMLLGTLGSGDAEASIFPDSPDSRQVLEYFESFLVP